MHQRGSHSPAVIGHGHSDTLTVLCAPNAFKGTMTARAVAAAMAAAVRELGMQARLCPVADGGDGTLDVLLGATPGSRVTVHDVTGPLGDRIAARLGWLDSRTAVVEIAEACGLRLLADAPPQPLRATSRGAGELIARALDGKATAIIVGVGGSACTDGGAGILQALGMRFIDAQGEQLGIGGGELIRLARVDSSGLDPRLGSCHVTVAADVTNPLLGPDGSAAVFAPQKGATTADVAVLERGIEQLARTMAIDLGVRFDTTRRRGSGAAGGCGFGLAAGIGAVLTSGGDLVCDRAHVDDLLEVADVCLTGEGRLDAQTVSGKAPAVVLARARRHGVPCIAVTGQVTDGADAGFESAVVLDSEDLDHAAAVHRATRDVLTRWLASRRPR